MTPLISGSGADRRNSFSWPMVQSWTLAYWAWSVVCQISRCRSSTSSGCSWRSLILVLARRARAFVPRGLVRGPHPDRLIPLLEVVRGTDHLLVKRLIEATLDSADVREDVLARLDLRDR